ncbi:hypothetical protein ACIPYR_14910 [Streptomyces parvus]|uniref:hypothetical protein n=1 Tax=Streptomyces parvus TaxID=66428 RepID=UPI003820A4E9
MGQLEQRLLALPGLHQDCLHHVLSTSRRRNPTKVSGSRRRDHLNLSALDARNDLIPVLTSWSGLVAERLGVAAPYRSVRHLTDFLTLHLAWLTTQSAAADFADEIEGLHTELLRAIDPDAGDHGPPVTPCVVDACTGTIDASPKNAGKPGTKSISCSAGHSWETREWLTLRHLMDRRRKDAA